MEAPVVEGGFHGVDLAANTFLDAIDYDGGDVFVSDPIVAGGAGGVGGEEGVFGVDVVLGLDVAFDALVFPAAVAVGGAVPSVRFVAWGDDLPDEDIVLRRVVRGAGGAGPGGAALVMALTAELEFGVVLGGEVGIGGGAIRVEVGGSGWVAEVAGVAVAMGIVADGASDGEIGGVRAGGEDGGLARLPGLDHGHADGAGVAGAAGTHAGGAAIGVLELLVEFGVDPGVGGTGPFGEGGVVPVVATAAGFRSDGGDGSDGGVVPVGVAGRAVATFALHTGEGGGGGFVLETGFESVAGGMAGEAAGGLVAADFLEAFEAVGVGALAPGAVLLGVASDAAWASDVVGVGAIGLEDAELAFDGQLDDAGGRDGGGFLPGGVIEGAGALESEGWLESFDGDGGGFLVRGDGGNARCWINTAGCGDGTVHTLSAGGVTGCGEEEAEERAQDGDEVSGKRGESGQAIHGCAAIHGTDAGGMHARTSTNWRAAGRRVWTRRAKHSIDDANGG